MKHDYVGHNSNILTPPDSDGTCTDKLEQYLGKDLRRYSDTKLLGSVDVEACDPMLECHSTAAAATAAAHRSNISPQPPTSTTTRMRQLVKQQSESAATATAASHHKHTVLDMELPQSPLSPSVVQNLPQSQILMRRSLHTVDMDKELNPRNSYHHNNTINIMSGGSSSSNSQQQQQHHHQQQQQQGHQHIDKGRLFFKSLPNLSSSCESLIKK